MPLAPRPSPPIDPTTLKHVVQLLRERAAAVETYGAGGCPTCHDAELRGAIAMLESLAARSGPSA